MKTGVFVLSMLVMGVAFVTPGSAAPVVFSEGMTTPETISQAPASFGSYAGEYFIPDPHGTAPDNNTIWVVPAAGGPPSIFIDVPRIFDDSPNLGGLFLPPGFGAFGGQYVVGLGPNAASFGPAGEFHIFGDAASLGYTTLTTPAIAPAGFGSSGGNLVFTAQYAYDDPTASGAVVQIAPSGTTTLLGATPGLHPFGLAFAPNGFGSVGGNLLVSNAAGNDIIAMNGLGQSYYFASIPNVPLAGGLRQIGFVPAGFGKISGDLLVSVSASAFGSAGNGALDVVDSSGHVVETLNTGGAPFNPRGFTFTSDGHILISDATDPILSATPADFVPYTSVPEINASAVPAVCSLLGGMLMVLVDRTRRRKGA